MGVRARVRARVRVRVRVRSRVRVRPRASTLRPVVVRPRALSSVLSSATVGFAEAETEAGGELAEVEVKPWQAEAWYMEP